MQLSSNGYQTSEAEKESDCISYPKQESINDCFQLRPSCSYLLFNVGRPLHVLSFFHRLMSLIIALVNPKSLLQIFPTALFSQSIVVLYAASAATIRKIMSAFLLLRPPLLSGTTGQSSTKPQLLFLFTRTTNTDGSARRGSILGEQEREQGKRGERKVGKKKKEKG